jgi:hypothetical protein
MTERVFCVAVLSLALLSACKDKKTTEGGA